MSCPAISSAKRASSSAASASVRSGTGAGESIPQTYAFLSREAGEGGVSGVHEGAGGGARGVGDLGAGQHARDLLLALGGGEVFDGGADALALPRLGDPPVGVGAGGDLGRMGGDQDPRRGGQGLLGEAPRVRA